MESTPESICSTDRINDVENNKFEITQLEWNKEGEKMSKESLHDLWDSTKRANIGIIVGFRRR